MKYQKSYTIYSTILLTIKITSDYMRYYRTSIKNCSLLCLLLYGWTYLFVLPPNVFSNFPFLLLIYHLWFSVSHTLPFTINVVASRNCTYEFNGYRNVLICFDEKVNVRFRYVTSMINSTSSLKSWTNVLLYRLEQFLANTIWSNVVIKSPLERFMISINTPFVDEILGNWYRFLSKRKKSLISGLAFPICE